MNRTDIEKGFSGCRSFLDAGAWREMISECRDDENPEFILDRILLHCRSVGTPGFLPELARLEWRILKIKEQEIATPDQLNELIPNPSLHLLEFCWKNLTDCLNASGSVVPEPGREFVAIWKHPVDGRVRAKVASPEDLLVLKMILDRKSVV